MEKKYKRGVIEKDGKKYGFYPDGSLYRIYENDRPFITFIDENGDTYMCVRQATELGYAKVPVNGCVDLAYPSSTLRRGRTIGEGRIVNALTCGQMYGIFLEIS